LASIEGYKIIAKRDLVPTLDGYEATQRVAAVTTPEVADVDASAAFTTSFLDQLREGGINEELGVPSQ
jgi:hypothetical protein